jgi:phage regulator Rha-like protein
MAVALCVLRDFDMQHKTVLRAFDNLTCSPEFSRHNFEQRDYVDEPGKPR